MVASLVYEVIARYVFDAPTVWAYDMTFMLYGTFFMLGSAWTLQRGGHIRTDTFYADWSPRTPRAASTRRATCCSSCRRCSCSSTLGAEYFWKSFQQNERIVTSPWLPIVWPFKFVMPLTAVLLIIQGVSELIKSIRVSRARRCRRAREQRRRSAGAT